MSVSSQNPFISFTANGATTIFTFNFKSLASADLKVYVDDVLQNSGYTVTLRATDGDIVFSVAPSNGAVVIIARNVGLARTEVYTERGSFLGDTVNDDFDKRQMALQEISSRTILQSLVEQAKNGGTLILPNYTAGMAIGWDISSRALVNMDVGGSSTENTRLKSWAYSQSFELVSATRNSNDVITTANIKWPDGATGTFTATTINNTFNTIDAWQATHILSGVTKTITQSAVTRNLNGAVTAQPEITIT